MKAFWRSFRMASTVLLLAVLGLAAPFPEDYDIAWTSPSANSAGSMPVSGGDIGLNAWVEGDDLLFYMARIGQRDENGSILKSGRMRLNLSPNPFSAGFRQELDLATGAVTIAGAGGAAGSVKLWVEVHRHVIHVDIAMDREVAVSAAYESWRFRDRSLPNGAKDGPRGMCAMNFDGAPVNVVLRADSVDVVDQSIRFRHRVEGDGLLFDYSVSQQDLAPIQDQLWNPLRNLTWGGLIRAEGFTFAGTGSGQYSTTPFRSWKIQSQAPAKSHTLRIFLHKGQTATAEAWEEELLAKAGEAVTDASAWSRNLAWWKEFWNRSHIVVNPGKGPADGPWSMGRNYQLFRYMLAANSSGNEATSFAGGIFTFDPQYASNSGHQSGDDLTPDHRRWGTGLTAQNQRLVVWPLLKSGDFDLLVPGFDFYSQGLGNARARTRHYWGHEGCSFNEQTSSLAFPGPAIYGYPTGSGIRYRPPGTERGVEVASSVGKNYQGQLEYAWMILQYHRFSGQDISAYLPFIEQSVIFYDEHYRYRRSRSKGAPLDGDGKYEIHPSNTLENSPNATNPTEVIAGMTRVLSELLRLPPTYTAFATPEKRARWQGMLAAIPPYPTGTRNGVTYVRPSLGRDHNHDHTPEMYPVYPYELTGPGRKDYALFRDTFLNGVISASERMNGGAWYQGVIHFAHLGRADEAGQTLAHKLRNGPYRFPGFSQGGDYTPDHNRSGSGMIGLQDMLLQTLDSSLHLLPAWPAGWDADFKLHAPFRTVVEGKVAGGRLTSLSVTPRERLKDVLVGPDRVPVDPKVVALGSVRKQAGISRSARLGRSAGGMAITVPPGGGNGSLRTLDGRAVRNDPASRRRPVPEDAPR